MDGDYVHFICIDKMRNISFAKRYFCFFSLKSVLDFWIINLDYKGFVNFSNSNTKHLLQNSHNNMDHLSHHMVFNIENTVVARLIRTFELSGLILFRTKVFELSGCSN